MNYQDLIDSGIDVQLFQPSANITSLYISDSKHSIPIYYGLVQKQNVVGSFIFPEEMTGTKALARLASQARTYGPSIAEYNKENATKEGQQSLFIGLDAARYDNVNTEKWPTIEELRENGISRLMVFIDEVPGPVYGLDHIAEDLRAYVANMRDNGIAVYVAPVNVLGVE